MAFFLPVYVSASLWAFAHLDTDGEGLGQRTQYGYLFMLNLLLTPMLMVIGLILSLLVMKVAGSLFAFVFPIVMADIQADSITGLLSIGAFIVIFCTTSVALVTNACDLIHYIPDHGLDFLGGATGGQHGKKMSDNFAGAAGGAVMAAIGSGAMDAQKSVKADVAARKKANADAADKDKGGGTRETKEPI